VTTADLTAAEDAAADLAASVDLAAAESLEPSADDAAQLTLF
jgi:hypothetical protein